MPTSTKTKTSKPTPDPKVVAEKMRAATKAKAPASAAKPNGNGNKPAPKAIVVDTAKDPTSRTRRTAAAKVEDKALKAWERGGRKGKRPSTANLDAIKAESDARARGESVPKRRRSASSGTPRTTTSVTFYRRGKVLNGFGLARIAFRFTAGLIGKRERLSAEDFRAYLVSKHNIKTPDTSTWRIVLANGEDIGAVAKGDKLPALSAAAQKRVAEPRQSATPTKRAPAKATATAAFKRTRKATTSRKRK